LTGDFALEQATVNLKPTGTATQLRIGVSNLQFSIGDGTNNLIAVSAGTGFFVINTSGLAGSLSATVASNVSDVSLGGTFTIAINTTGATVNETFLVGADTVTLNVPAGPFVRVTG